MPVNRLGQQGFANTLRTKVAKLTRQRECRAKTGRCSGRAFAQPPAAMHQHVYSRNVALAGYPALNFALAPLAFSSARECTEPRLFAPYVLSVSSSLSRRAGWHRTRSTSRIRLRRMTLKCWRRRSRLRHKGSPRSIGGRSLPHDAVECRKLAHDSHIAFAPFAQKSEGLRVSGSRPEALARRDSVRLLPPC